MNLETLNVPVAAAASGASKYDRLITDARGVPPVPAIVAHPCDETSLRVAIEAATWA